MLSDGQKSGFSDDNKGRRISIMRKIRVVTALLVFMFAVMTFFFIVLINQAKINDINNLYYNNFYSQNAVRFSISKKGAANAERELEIPLSDFSGSFAFYNALEETIETTYTKDRVRVIYMQGNDFPKPHIVAGRFFTEEDILSEEPLCVVGMTTFDRNVDAEGYYSYYDAFSNRRLKCKVIGVMQMPNGAASDIDVTVMINWNGYYNGYDRISGMFYIDSNSKYASDAVFNELKSYTEDYCETEDEFTVVEMMMTGNIRSFSYFTYYLFVLGAVIMTICIIMVSLRYCEAQARKTAIKKLCGFSSATVYAETTLLITAISVIGLIIGLLVTALLRISVEFRYSETGYYTNLSFDTVLLVCAAVIVYSFVVAVFPSIKAYSTDTSSALK